MHCRPKAGCFSEAVLLDGLGGEGKNFVPFYHFRDTFLHASEGELEVDHCYGVLSKEFIQRRTDNLKESCDAHFLVNCPLQK